MARREERLTLQTAAAAPAGTPRPGRRCSRTPSTNCTARTFVGTAFWLVPADGRTAGTFVGAASGSALADDSTTRTFVSTTARPVLADGRSTNRQVACGLAHANERQ
ncbi:hypothetical protein LFM09_40155 [Lentzea alba]|uniref:hypothetical protein n=1 Tax=Lentzea alba TaxID=2714351 RepID=UPI0039BEECBC